MPIIEVSRKYDGTIDDLTDAGNRIHSALTADVHQALLERMPETFTTDLLAAIAALAKALADQKDATGKVATAVSDLNDAAADCRLATRAVRGVAKREFAGQDSVLHTEFAVGRRGPNGIVNFVADVVATQAACVKYAERLGRRGWSPADTTALAASLATLKGALAARQEADAVQHRATGHMVNMANAVYDLCRTVQIIADETYPAADASDDASMVEARERFLIGIFPPRVTAPSGDPTNPATPIAPTAPSTPPTGGV